MTDKERELRHLIGEGEYERFLVEQAMREARLNSLPARKEPQKEIVNVMRKKA